MSGGWKRPAAVFAAALTMASAAGASIPDEAVPIRETGYGQIRYRGLGPEAWHFEVVKLRRKVASLRRALRRRPSSLEAIRLASVTYRVPFATLYRKASCESTGSRPADPPSERTLDPLAANPSSTASGLLQFIDSTWNSTPFAGFSVWSPYANALAGGWMHANGRSGEWVCQ